MVAFQSVFKMRAVFAVFADAVVDVANVFLCQGPSYRVAAFGYNFLLVAIAVDRKFGDVFAFGQVPQQAEHLTEFALNNGPKVRTEGISLDLFGFPQLKDGITQSLNVFFLAPKIKKQVRQPV